MRRRTFILSTLAGAAWSRRAAVLAAGPALTISWANDVLTLRSTLLPTGKLDIWYLEAYCRAGSTDRDWDQTTIGHRTELLSPAEDDRRIELRCTLHDGVTVRHDITAGDDEVDFRLTAHNPTDQVSEAHWAQPCIRVGDFTGLDQQAYIRKCFIFLAGRMERLPTPDWATCARYTPGQAWAAPGVDRNDVNPRPLNPHTPSNGLIGCFSADESLILASAWHPWQELFQGIGRCIHSDFRIGGLTAGETKTVRGKIYLVPADAEALRRRYEVAFPEHVARAAKARRGAIRDERRPAVDALIMRRATVSCPECTAEDLNSMSDRHLREHKP